MTTEIRVPQLPESIADATLVAWHKQPGDAIRRDENLADLETDKVVLEVPAPANGVVREIRVPSGAVVTSGQVLALIEEGAAAAAAPKPAGTAATAAAAKTPPAADSDGGKDAGKLSPSVRRLVEENHLDPSAIPASGRDGRLTKSDVVGFLGKQPAEATPRAAGAPPPAAPAAPAPAARAPTPRPAAPAGARAEQRVPMTRLRARIAQRLIEAQSTQALLTTFNEVDLTATQELRARYKERFEKEHGVKLGFMSFFVIEKEVADYARKAREGSLTIEDLTGGTFTITNGGVFGSLMSTPIVNTPQSAILGMHKIQERPMVLGGQIAARPMMYLAVTYDHRSIDGREAVQFLVAIKEALEDPGRMLLGI